MDTNMNGIMFSAIAAFCWALEAIRVKKGESGMSPILGAAAGSVATGAIFLLYLLLTNNFKTIFYNNSMIYYDLAGIIALVIGRVFYFLARGVVGLEAVREAIRERFPRHEAVNLAFDRGRELVSGL